ncbi:putative cyclopentanone -monooxygenase protein [Botrytis fragariae]|uniref:Putative cyclopentanone -monooxygenase protein n=1 Tax=Botrytis fragariae TaxID=1964551 RepID=A0A8H6AHD7_9HELO|nr:putative cyclopentanone -monooxygenase protein [Botrytis fragariae]KAF5867454.1 putative cyclopentanone -monooxygenase protein [Botrytis fragariae]
MRRCLPLVSNPMRLKQDIQFNVRVTHGQFREDRWYTTTIACPEPGTVPHIASFLGLESFQGTVTHSYKWPEEGTGASGVQIVQDWAKRADHLTVFQRTPNTVLPMHPEGWHQDPKMTREEFSNYRRTHSSGVDYQSLSTNTFDTVNPAERHTLREHPWHTGGMRYVYANYQNVMINRAANREIYDFWAQKFRSRIKNPRKRDLWRPSSLYTLWARKDLPVKSITMTSSIVGLRSTSIYSFQAGGFTATDGQFYLLDIVALATGFDTITGGLTHVVLHSVDGESLKDQ